jgi:prepilin-type N-terminal cleavage/methylation domain-containing protein
MTSAGLSTRIRLGFTLIEIMVAIAIVVVLATIVIPAIKPRNPANERTLFITQFNALLRAAVHMGAKTNKTQRVVVNLEKRIVSLETETDKKDDKGEPVYAPTKGLSSKRVITIPKNLQIKNLYIEGADEMERFESSTKTAWFFITPEGRAQQVTINIIDIQDKIKGKPRVLGLVLNPFSAQFEEHDTFQK